MKKTKKIIGRLLFIAGDAALIHAGFLAAFWIGFGEFPERKFSSYPMVSTPIISGPNRGPKICSSDTS